MKCGSLLNFFVSFATSQTNNMAVTLDDKTVAELRNLADRLRIDSIRATNASKSG
jgi:hypothetical protein